MSLSLLQKELVQKRTDVITGHTKAVVSLAYSFDGRLLATAGADKKAVIISTETGIKLLDLEGEHTEGLNDCCWIDERLLVTASDDNTIVLWDAEYGKPITTFRGHHSYVYCVSCNPMNRAIYSGGFDGNIMVFDVASSTCVLSFDAHADAVCAIDYCPADNNMFVTGSHDGLVRIWDATSISGCMTTIYNETRPPIASVSYAANGQYLLVSALDSTHRMFSCPLDTPDNTVYVDAYKAHLNTKYSVLSRISLYQGGAKDMSYIVSGSEDNKLYLWDVNDHANNEVATTLEGHQDVVLAVACQPDPTIIQVSSAGRDGSVIIWGLAQNNISSNSLNGSSSSSSSSTVVTAAASSGSSTVQTTRNE